MNLSNACCYASVTKYDATAIRLPRVEWQSQQSRTTVARRLNVQSHRSCNHRITEQNPPLVRSDLVAKRRCCCDCDAVFVQIFDDARLRNQLLHSEPGRVGLLLPGRSAVCHCDGDQTSVGLRLRLLQTVPQSHRSQLVHFGLSAVCYSSPLPHPAYYAALLPTRGPHIASHSVCPSVRLSVCLSVRPSHYGASLGATQRITMTH